MTAAWIFVCGLGAVLLILTFLIWNLQLLARVRTSTVATLRWYLQLAIGLLIAAVLISYVAVFAASTGFGALIFVVMLVGAVSLTLVMAEHRAAENRSLIWTLASAAEKGAPLHDAARAYADERNDGLGRAARQLALYLQAGTALPAALAASGKRMRLDERLAVEAGTRLGILSTLLKVSLEDTDEVDGQIRTTTRLYVYLLAVAAIGLFIAVFLCARILPVFMSMFPAWQLRPPLSLTLWLQLAMSWKLAALVLSPALAAATGLLVLMLAHYCGMLPSNMWGVGILAAPLDGARVLRVLAAATAEGRSLAETLRFLAARFPRRRVRQKLVTAGEAVSRGVAWFESLYNSGVIPRGTAAVLEAAHRTGNLPWALHEMAGEMTRRAADRIRFWTVIVYPICIVVLGLVFSTMAAAVLLPLVELGISLA